MSRRTKKHRNANINLEKKMAKAKSRKARGESVYRITELVGTSTVSWEDAAKRAIETAAGSLRDLRVADIVKLDVKVDGGKVVAYRARVSLRRDRSQCRDCGRGGFGRVRSELQVNKLGARCFFPQELPEPPVQRRR